MKEELIAPCGMNCGLCAAYLFRELDLNKKGFHRTYCPGCIPRGKNCTHMADSCDLIGKGEVRFCFDCVQYPCKRLKNLDKRYRTKYHMSMIENLNAIRDVGMESFLEAQEERWRCPTCGGSICCHNGLCLNCQLDTFLQNKKYRWNEPKGDKHMQSLNESIRVYTAQLQLGQIQKAYKGIMTFMSALKTYLENRHPDFLATGLYFGYMDMTYFAFTPLELKQCSLKIAIVYLHEQNRFEVWLSGANRSVQAKYINLLKYKYLGDFILSEGKPGVDSIIELKLIEKPDFDHPEKLMRSIEGKVVEFIVGIEEMLLPLV